MPRKHVPVYNPITSVIRSNRISVSKSYLPDNEWVLHKAMGR